MAEVVLQDATRDRSFAGLFPYASNAPMKVFAGNEPAVPVSVLVDALDDMQRGSAGSDAKAAAKNHLTPQLGMCVMECQKQHESCIQATNAPKDAYEKCHASLMQVCLPQCMKK